jgi:hypothetical protein
MPFIRSCIVPAKEAVASRATDTSKEHAKKVSMEIAGTLFPPVSSYWHWRYAEHS